MDFINACKEFGIELSEKQLSQFEEYFHLLTEWNEKMNLTAITEKEEVYLKHFLDSLSLMMAFRDFTEDSENALNSINQSDDEKAFSELYNKIGSGEFSFIDIGTGAGFPGIPLKILFPNAHVTLMDSLNKRITFLNEVTEVLKLNESGSVECIHARAEELAQNKEYREQYDFVVSRAVANLSTLTEYCLPFAKVGGFFISYKSEKAGEEIAVAGNAIFLCGGVFRKEVSFTLPQSDIKRSLLFIEKRQNTAKKYPRKAGLPSKSPL